MPCQSAKYAVCTVYTVCPVPNLFHVSLQIWENPVTEKPVLEPCFAAAFHGIELCFLLLAEFISDDRKYVFRRPRIEMVANDIQKQCMLLTEVTDHHVQCMATTCTCAVGASTQQMYIHCFACFSHMMLSYILSHADCLPVQGMCSGRKACRSHSRHAQYWEQQMLNGTCFTCKLIL